MKHTLNFIIRWRFYHLGIILFLNILGSITISSQSKFEKEERIELSEAPASAVAFIESLALDQSHKWYLEQSQDGVTYEYKTKYNRHKYSIEFDTSGRVLDIEKTVSFKSIDPIIRRKIQNSLALQFSKYKINKIQLQWIADTETLRDLVISGDTEMSYDQNYELVIKANKEGKKDFYEVLFDSNGEIRKLLKVIQRGTSNLEF